MIDIHLHLKTSELIKAGFAFGLGLQLSSAVVAFASASVKEIDKKSENKVKNEEKAME